MTKTTDPTPESPALIQEIIDGLRSGKFEVQAGHSRIVLKRITPPKRKTGKEPSESDILEGVIKTTTKHGLELDEETPTKRIYRKPKDRPDPSQPGNAEVNRLNRQFKVRADESLIERMNEAARKAGVTRQDWLIEAALEKLGQANE